MRLSLLVIDDRALGPLNDLQRIGSYGVISVLAAAWRSTAMLVAAPVWAAKPVWAMVCRNLSTVPTPLLPSGLRCETVDVEGQEATGEVDLLSAAALAVQADRPSTNGPSGSRRIFRHLHRRRVSWWRSTVRMPYAQRRDIGSSEQTRQCSWSTPTNAVGAKESDKP